MGTKEYWEQQTRHPVPFAADGQDLFSGYWASRYLGNLKHMGTGRRILDIGCGDAKYFTRLDNNFDELYGIELSDTHFKAAIDTFPEGRYLVADGIHLPFKDNSFDAVLSVGAFEHNEDIGGIFQECHRVLRYNGTLLFSVPNYVSTYFPYCYAVHLFNGDDRVESIGHHFSRKKLRRELKTAGFGDIEFIDSIYAAPLPPIAAGLGVGKALLSLFTSKATSGKNESIDTNSIRVNSKLAQLATVTDDKFARLFHPLEYLGFGFMRVIYCVKK